MLTILHKTGGFSRHRIPRFLWCFASDWTAQSYGVEIPTDPRDGIDLDVLASVFSSMDIKACWFMTESQNPLGYSMSETNKQRLAELVNHYQIPMIEDDVYRELGIGNPSSLPAKAYDKVGNILLCGSFSKSLSPGFRIGWVVAGERALNIQRLQHLSTLSSSIPIQLGYLITSLL